MMKTVVKSEDMDIDAQGVLTVLGAVFTGSFIGGLTALIKQAKKNTETEVRLKNLEEERQDIKEIKDTIIVIQINNAKYFTIMEANQKHLASVAGSVQRIHTRLDEFQIKKTGD